MPHDTLSNDNVLKYGKTYKLCNPLMMSKHMLDQAIALVNKDFNKFQVLSKSAISLYIPLLESEIYINYKVKKMKERGRIQENKILNKEYNWCTYCTPRCNYLLIEFIFVTNRILT